MNIAPCEMTQSSPIVTSSHTNAWDWMRHRLPMTTLRWISTNGPLEVHVLAEHGLAVDSFVVDRDLVVRNIVVNDHLLGSDDGHLSHFLGIQPTHVNVRDHSLGIHEVEKDDVIHASLNVVHAL